MHPSPGRRDTARRLGRETGWAGRARCRRRLPVIRPQECPGIVRELRFQRLGGVRTDYGEVPVGQFEEVRAMGAPNAASLTWRGADPTEDLGHLDFLWSARRPNSASSDPGGRASRRLRVAAQYSRAMGSCIRARTSPRNSSRLRLPAKNPRGGACRLPGCRAALIGWEAERGRTEGSEGRMDRRHAERLPRSRC